MAVDVSSVVSSTEFVDDPNTHNTTPTIASDVNAILLVAAIKKAASGRTLDGVTWNSVALTNYTPAQSDDGSRSGSQVWYLVNPATGQRTLSVDPTGQLDGLVYVLFALTGVHPVFPIEAGAQKIITTGNSPDTVTVPGVSSGSLLVEIAHMRDASSLSWGTDQVNTGFVTGGFAWSTKSWGTSAPSMTISWTSGAIFNSAHSVVSVRPQLANIAISSSELRRYRSMGVIN